MYFTTVEFSIFIAEILIYHIIIGIAVIYQFVD